MGKTGIVPHLAKSCVSLVPIFKTLAEPALRNVAQFATPRHLERGEALYRQGESVAQLFVMHEGEAKLTHLRADGQEQIVRTVGPGEVVGEHAFLTGARPDHTVTALDAMQVCVFDHRDLGRLTATHPQIATEMLRAMSQRLVDTEAHLTTLTLTDVTTRLANYLLNLPARREANGLVVSLPMSKREVASYLGTTPESMSRALTRLEQDQMIAVLGRRIALLDPDGLDDMAG